MTKRTLNKPEQNVLSPVYFSIDYPISSVDMWAKQTLLRGKIINLLSKLNKLPTKEFTGLSLENLLETLFTSSLVNESVKFIVKNYKGVLY